MCGIAGFISSRVTPAERALTVDRMSRSLAHRGPDDEGLVSAGPATFSLRRLAIFDPARGHQPWQSPDGRYTLAFNGAIYNFRELRETLRPLGHAFETDCDTEVLLASFQQWGEACLDRLRGMFAFAVWDNLEQRAFLARDPFGIKPLYFSVELAPDSLVFASEIRAFEASGLGGLATDPAALSEYLAFLSIPAPRTLYRQIRSLRAGEFARWTPASGGVTVQRFWRLQFPSSHPDRTRSVEEFRHGLRAQLEDTVAAHLQADVPVGIFLSGGLDSAVLTAVAARHIPRRLRTFSLGFEERSFSETTQAEATARHLGTHHSTSILTAKRLVADFDHLLGAMDQPTGDGINTYYASAAARQGRVTVALSGLGADELFGGYNTFAQIPQLARVLPYWRALPAAARKMLLRLLSRRGPRAQKLGQLLSAARSVHDLAANSRRVWSARPASEILMIPETTALHPEADRIRQEQAETDLPSLLSTWEIETYMNDVLLRDSDCMSMRHAIELRVPFVDRKLIEWWSAQPSAFRYTPESPKSALLEAVYDLLPPEIAARKKWGFTLPFSVWMRWELRPFLDEIFSVPSVRKSGFFSVAAVNQRWRTFLASNDPRDWSRLWSLAVLIAHLNQRKLTR